MDKRIVNYLIGETVKEEISIVQMMGDGLSTSEIAKKLDKSARTIETQTYQLRKRFGCRSSIGLIVLFFRNKLIK